MAILVSIPVSTAHLLSMYYATVCNKQDTPLVSLSIFSQLSLPCMPSFVETVRSLCYFNKQIIVKNRSSAYQVHHAINKFLVLFPNTKRIISINSSRYRTVVLVELFKCLLTIYVFTQIFIKATGIIGLGSNRLVY